MFTACISCVDTYNICIYDLLEELPEIGPQRPTKTTQEDIQHNMYVHAYTKVEVKSSKDGLEVVYLGFDLQKIISVRRRCQEMEMENSVMLQKLVSLRELHSDSLVSIPIFETQVHNTESVNDSLQR